MSRMKLRWLLMGALLVGSARLWAAAWPVTVTDDRGQRVTIPAPPQRVATISAFGADLLAALGRQPIAITSYGDARHELPLYLGEAIQGAQDLGRRHHANLEQLARLAPDLTIAIRRYTEPYARKFEEIAPYLAFDTITYEDSDRAIAVAARALGVAEAGQRLNEAFARLLATYRQQAPGGVSAVVLWGGSESPFAFYEHSMVGTLLKALKVENVAGATPTPELKRPFGSKLSLETLLSRDPDVVLVMMPANSTLDTRNNPLWCHLKAVRNGRVYRVGFHYLEPQGPLARRYVLQEMAHLLYPDRFPPPADLPPQAAARVMTTEGY